MQKSGLLVPIIIQTLFNPQIGRVGENLTRKNFLWSHKD